MTSLATKLGLHPGQLVWLLDAPAAALQLLQEEAPAGVEIEPIELMEQELPGAEDIHCDLLFVWPQTLDGLAEAFARWQWAIVADGALWVVMPKKAFARQQGITFSWEEMQAAALTTDLVDNKIAAFSAESYATRFVIRKERRSAYAPR